MKKLLGILLGIIITATSVSANVISADVMKKDLQNVIFNNYSTKTPATLDIKVTMLPFQSISLPDGVIRYELINSDATPALNSRDVRRVNIYVNNVLQRTICVPFEVKAYEDVLVATTAIGREQPINALNTRLKRVNVSDKGNFVLSGNITTKDIIAKKEYKENEIIDKRFVKIRPDVVRNSDVRIILTSSEGFQIAINGTAQADGTIGEYITVENKEYKKVYRAKIIGENQVLVNI